MSNEDKKSGGLFGGIGKKLGSLIYETTPEEQAKTQEQEVPVKKNGPSQGVNPSATVFATTSPTSVIQQPTTPFVAGISPAEIEETKEKIYGFIEKINLPGIDFLEYWNTLEAMEGGITDANVKNAFVAVKVMSGNQVTKDLILSTGSIYITKITEAINADIAGKNQEKKKLQDKLNLEKQNLQQEAENLNTTVQQLQQQIIQIQETIRQKTTEISEKQIALGQLDAKYAPEMQKVDNLIVCGSTGLKSVVTEIEQVRSLVDRVIQ